MGTGWGEAGGVCNIRSFCKVHLEDPAMPEMRRCCAAWGRTLCCGTEQCKRMGRNFAYWDSRRVEEIAPLGRWREAL